MISIVLRAWSIVRVATKRLFAERGLALSTAAGLVASVALTMSIPLYADAVYFRILREVILGEGAEIVETPLSFRFRYVGARDGALEWEHVQSISAYLAKPAAQTLRLPHSSLTYHFKTDIFRLYWPEGDPGASQGLTWISFATLNELDRHVHVQMGSVPAVSGSTSDDTVDVLIYEPVAYEFGWQVGEMYLAKRNDVEIPIRIAGTWIPAEPHAKFWSAPMEELALVPEQTFAGRISSCLDGEIYAALWQLVVDGGDLHASGVAGLLERMGTMEREAVAYLPHVVLDDSPEETLQDYRRGVPELTFQLFAFSIPIVGLLLAFIGLVAGLYVAQKRNEIAVLRSRGATRMQIVGIAALEGVILGGVALLLGSVAGMGIAWLIGRVRSFLDFTAPPNLRVDPTLEVAAIGVAAVMLALVAQLLPTSSAAGHTIVTYKQEQARSLRPPWWQRVWLDGLLLVPTAYGFYVLRRQGSLAAAGGTAIGDTFGNPLLFLTPTLGLFALALFLARLLPFVMAAVAWMAARTNGVGLLVAARQLSRAPGVFAGPLILLTLTLSLSAFTASLAQTLDTHLSKQMFYQAGADLRLDETGISIEGDTGPSSPITGIDSQRLAEEIGTGTAGARWLFRPVEMHLRLPGVQKAARVGRYAAVIESINVPVRATFMGVDRMTFPTVAYWQDDFSPESLGGLMNALASAPESVLVSRDFMAQQGLRVGDWVNVITNAHDDTVAMTLRIAGAFDLFPTWYPDDGPLFVGNLDHFFEQAGYTFPYEVWLETSADADQRQIVASVRGLTALLDPAVDSRQVVEDGLNILVTDWWSAPLDILAEQRRPQRQGLFGLLSVGFIASALLTVLGFLLYALFSFRRRFIELGVLRAVGLSTGQMTALLAAELASLISIGLVAGTGLGVWVSTWFIPFLQVGVEASSRYPPFVVQIAWSAITRIYFVFGGLFVIALGGLTALLLRIKIFQAVKMGETI